MTGNNSRDPVFKQAGGFSRTEMMTGVAFALLATATLALDVQPAAAEILPALVRPVRQ
jgi:hypothetical protein